MDYKNDSIYGIPDFGFRISDSKAWIWLAFTAVAIILMLTSCSTIKEQAQVPAGCEQSVIWKNVPYPVVLESGLVIAVSEALFQFPAAKPYVVTVMSSLADSLKDGRLTYAEFAKLAVQGVTWVNEYYGARLMVWTELITMFDAPIPIDSCDRDLLNKYLNEQVAALNA